jgi:hypothetical protein
MKRFSVNGEVEDPRVDAFLAEVFEVCRKHGMALEAEDGGLEVIDFEESPNGTREALNCARDSRGCQHGLGRAILNDEARLCDRCGFIKTWPGAWHKPDETELRAIEEYELATRGERATVQYFATDNEARGSDVYARSVGVCEVFPGSWLCVTLSGRFYDDAGSLWTLDECRADYTERFAPSHTRGAVGA